MRVPANISLSRCNRCYGRRIRYEFLWQVYWRNLQAGGTKIFAIGYFGGTEDAKRSIGGRLRAVSGGGLVAQMEVDASGNAEAVLDVLCAVGEARVDEVELYQAQIEAVIDVKIHPAASLEIERGGVAGQHTFDRVLAGGREGVTELALDEDGAFAVPGGRADVADVIGVARPDGEGDGVNVDHATQIGAGSARAPGDEADSLPGSVGHLYRCAAEIEVGVGLVADAARGVVDVHHAEVAAGLSVGAGHKHKR